MRHPAPVPRCRQGTQAQTISVTGVPQVSDGRHHPLGDSAIQDRTGARVQRPTPTRAPFVPDDLVITAWSKAGSPL